MLGSVVQKGMVTLLRAPTAWLPFAISLVALCLALGYAAVVGVTPNADEGTPARIFQLLMLSQAVIVLMFAVRWLPRAPKPAGAIIALQVLVAAIPITAIIVLESRA
jgi:hypothetical protein